MREKVFEFINILLISLLFVLIISSSIRLTYTSYNLKDYSFYLMINGIIGLLLYITSKIKNFKFNKYEIIIIIMMILSCLSLLTAININDALFGKINRREGLFVILTYDILMLNCLSIKDKKYIKLIICYIFIYSLINIYYGLYQVGIFNNPHSFKVLDSWKYARGFLGNSMYFGTLMSIFYGISLGIFIKLKVGIKKFISFVILIISSLGIIMSGAMSSLLSVIVLYLVILVQCIRLMIKKNQHGKHYLICLIISLITFVDVFMIHTINHPEIRKDLQELVGETEHISEGIIEDSYGTGRIYIWKNTINKIIEHKGIGVGIDNFRNAFDSKLVDSKSKGIVDKAHNDYLQKMLCEGVIPGILFIVFLLMIFTKLFFSELNTSYYGLFLAFTSYSVQAFFNISVTRVAPIYFIIIGLLIGKIKRK